MHIADFDNDGWPDILATASAENGARPAVFRNLGSGGQIPRFAVPRGLGRPDYWVGGPTADFDHDGRIDVLVTGIDPAQPTMLLRGQAASKNWLEVSVADGPVDGVGHAYGSTERVGRATRGP